MLAFERCLRDILQAGMKYPDDPARFADSGIALHAGSDRLRLLTTSPTPPSSSPASSPSTSPPSSTTSSHHRIHGGEDRD